MAVLTASGLRKELSGEPLFDGVSFRLRRGDRLALAGPNGAGKTTLLRTIVGETSLTAGELAFAKGTRIALHDQRPPRGRGLTLREYSLSGAGDLVAIEDELARLEQAMAGGDHAPGTLRRYSEAQARLEHAGGWAWRDRAASILRGLGFRDADLDRPLDTFSGGELTRASLARALSADPDLLLLDEPTNHLDVESLEWLERELTSLDAAIVLVAHDRWFLEAVGTSVLEIEARRARFFAGPWHAWRKEQAARQIALGKAIERQEAEIARMERFVERFRYKATKARQAQSRIKRIEKMRQDEVTADPRDGRNLRFAFKRPERAGRFVLRAQDLRIEVPGRVLVDSVALQLERDEHAILVGPNGAGKTTLIELLAGVAEPAAGRVSHGHNVKVGYLSQHAETAAGEGTVLDAVRRQTGLTGQKARDLLGLFLFSGADADKQLSDISGGEQRRLSLAILVSSGANVLILDEPTNHLDIESREALEDALRAFEGAVVLVSHDRALLEAVGSRTLAIEDGALESHPVGWAAYQRELDERRAAAEAAASSNGGGAGEGSAGPGIKGPSKNARRKLGELETRIDAAEAALRDLESELADPAAWSSPGRAQRAGQRHQAAKAEVDRLYAEWEESQA